MEISSIIALLPAKFLVTAEKSAGTVASNRFDRSLVSSRADCRAGEFNSNGSFSSCLVVWLGTEPCEIRGLCDAP